MNIKQMIISATTTAETKGFEDAFLSLNEIIQKHGTEQDKFNLEIMYINQKQLMIISEVIEGVEALRYSNRIDPKFDLDSLMFLDDDEFKDQFEKELKNKFEVENIDTMIRAGSLSGVIQDPEVTEKLIKATLRYNTLRSGNCYGKNF